MSIPLSISSAVPAIVSPLTGKAILPSSIQNPDAPPLNLPLTGIDAVAGDFLEQEARSWWP